MKQEPQLSIIAPRGVAQACDRTAIRHWQAARTAAPVRHQGVAGRQAAVHGATRCRSRTAPGPLRCRDRHSDVLSQAPQQQPNHELFPPRRKSLPLPLSSTHTTRLRGTKQNPRGGAPHKESQPTSEITPPPYECLPLPHSPTPRPLIRRISRAYPHIRSLSRF